jgi:hypothetical protein
MSQIAAVEIIDRVAMAVMFLNPRSEKRLDKPASPLARLMLPIVLQETACTPWRSRIELRCRPKSQKDGASLQSEAHHHEKMNVKDTAANLGVSVHMIYKLMRTGQLAYLQVGRRRLPLDDSVTEYRQKNTVKTHQPTSKPTRNPKTYKHMVL